MRENRRGEREKKEEGREESGSHVLRGCHVSTKRSF